MPTINIWTNVGVSVQTALASAKTFTAITAANPGVVTSTAHGYANGTYLYLPAIAGMKELNQAVVRVANQTANTFELENIDTTNFGTFTSGSGQAITFGAAAATMVDVNGSGGDAADVDTTTIHDSIAKVIPGLKSALKYDMQSIWDPSDAALIEFKKADDALAVRALLFAFKSGAKVAMAGYVTAPLVPTGSTGALVKTPVSLKVAGRASSWTT